MNERGGAAAPHEERGMSSVVEEQTFTDDVIRDDVR
jgi:hypothetical protein